MGYPLFIIKVCCCELLLSEIYLHRNTTEVPMLPNLILQEATVVVPDILWQVTEERKRRAWAWQGS